jgi:hypothetical protein
LAWPGGPCAMAHCGATVVGGEEIKTSFYLLTGALWCGQKVRMKATMGARGGAEALARVHGCCAFGRPNVQQPQPITKNDGLDCERPERFRETTMGWWRCWKGEVGQPTLPPTSPTLFLSPTATWLILPVVICLSQRLSHACPSISDFTVKLRKAH